MKSRASMRHLRIIRDSEAAPFPLPTLVYLLQQMASTGMTCTGRFWPSCWQCGSIYCRTTFYSCFMIAHTVEILVLPPQQLFRIGMFLIIFVQMRLQKPCRYGKFWVIKPMILSSKSNQCCVERYAQLLWVSESPLEPLGFRGFR